MGWILGAGDLFQYIDTLHIRTDARVRFREEICRHNEAELEPVHVLKYLMNRNDDSKSNGPVKTYR